MLTTRHGVVQFTLQRVLYCLMRKLQAQLDSLYIKKIEDDKPIFRYRDDGITVAKPACGTVLDYTLLDESVASLDHFLNKNPCGI